MPWFEDTISPEDSYETAKAKVEINVVFRYTIPVLPHILDRLERINAYESFTARLLAQSDPRR
jgi:hypothetical protein